MTRTRELAALLAATIIALPLLSCVSDRNGVVGPGGDGCAVPGSAIGPDQAVVFIRNLAFFPDTLRVAAGTRVTWVNCESSDMAHTSTATGGAWDSGLIEPGDSYARVFAAAGTTGYHCEPHPSMVGAVVVD